jgi:phosphoglycerate dehydrogenase-like enzyme
MSAAATLPQAMVVRLNAGMNPMGERERALYARHGLAPEAIEVSDPEELARALASCDAVGVISTRLPARVIEAMERCRVIARFGIGVDRIDVAAATARGIVVANVPGFCSDEMADHALALILALTRQLLPMTRAFAIGTWKEAQRVSLASRRLDGMQLGLVGFGDSARRLARRARACGMRIIATRRRLGEPDAEAAALGVEFVDLPALLGRADVVSLHLPLTPGTRRLIDRTALRAMKRGAYLINTSRGGLVDEDALVEALRDGSLAGAGLDTFEAIDPFALADGPPRHPLLELANVVLTPHVGANSADAACTVVDGGVDNLVSVLRGVWPRRERIVNPEVVPRRPLRGRESGDQP